MCDAHTLATVVQLTSKLAIVQATEVASKPHVCSISGVTIRNNKMCICGRPFPQQNNYRMPLTNHRRQASLDTTPKTNKSRTLHQSALPDLEGSGWRGAANSSTAYGAPPAPSEHPAVCRAARQLCPGNLGRYAMPASRTTRTKAISNCTPTSFKRVRQANPRTQAYKQGHQGRQSIKDRQNDRQTARQTRLQSE